MLQAHPLLKKLKTYNETIHFPNQHLSRYAIAAGLPFIVTVHDLARICFPFSKESLGEEIGLDLDAVAIKRARHIIAVSQSTKRDLMQQLGISEERITVIYNGVNHSIFKPRASPTFDFPYILYVGSERPRKNLSRLLAAFARLKKLGEFQRLKLVKVGSAGRSTTFRKNTLQAIKELGLEGEVIFTEHVTDQELSRCYSSASALVYPSLYEGFGLPILEAMACSCPVIASNVSSLPEVAGGAALLIDPYNVEVLFKAMAWVLTDTNLRKRLVARGQRHSLRFSWAETAAATWAVYCAVEPFISTGAFGLAQEKSCLEESTPEGADAYVRATYQITDSIEARPPHGSRWKYLERPDHPHGGQSNELGDLDTRSRRRLSKTSYPEE